MMSEATPVRLAIIGCGAMSELGHLPALQATNALSPTILIDSDEARAKALAEKFGVPHHSIQLADAAKYADAACVVVPHHVHTTVTCELIADGLHILIEKPLATTVTGCDLIIARAREQKVVLAVAMVRRFARTTKFLKEVLRQETFGKARSFSLVSGVAGVWPTKSAYLLSAEHSGGGVLMSNGVHDLDLLSHLFGPAKDVQFFADADFGRAKRLESDARVKLTTGSGVMGVMDISRTRDLKNGLHIKFERAHLFSPLFGDEITVTLPGDEPIQLSGLLDCGAHGERRQTFNDMLTLQLEDFAAAVRGEKTPVVDGWEGRQTIEIIERCYGNVNPLELPWRQPVHIPEGT